jgi:hypothetical protein
LADQARITEFIKLQESQSVYLRRPEPGMNHSALPPTGGESVHPEQNDDKLSQLLSEIPESLAFPLSGLNQDSPSEVENFTVFVDKDMGSESLASSAIEMRNKEDVQPCESTRQPLVEIDMDALIRTGRQANALPTSTGNKRVRSASIPDPNIPTANKKRRGTNELLPLTAGDTGVTGVTACPESAVDISGNHKATTLSDRGHNGENGETIQASFGRCKV